MIDSQRLRQAMQQARTGGQAEAEALARDFLFPLAAQTAAALRDDDDDGFDDLVQAAVVALWLNAHRVDLDGNPYSYLRNIARNAAVSELKKRRRWQAKHLPFETPIEPRGA